MWKLATIASSGMAKIAFETIFFLKENGLSRFLLQDRNLICLNELLYL